VALAAVAAVLAAVFSALAYLPDNAQTWAVPTVGVLAFIAIVTVLVYSFTRRHGVSRTTPPGDQNDW
jgi:membrane protein YdbS with pleckstrin-like domain